MFGRLDEFFEKDGSVAKGLEGFPAGFEVFCFQAGVVVHDAHAPASSAGSGFDDDRIPDAAGFCPGDFRAAQVGTAVFDHGDTQGAGQLFGGDLVAQALHDFRVGPHKVDAHFAATAGERHVFREEPIAWVDGVRPIFQGDAQDFFYVEVGPQRVFVLSDLICLVGLIAVQGVAVFKGIDRHGAQLELGGCPEHPDGDFAPVGDEQFLDGSNRCHSEMLSGSSKNTAPVAIPQLIFDVKLNRVFLKIDFL